MSPKERRRYPRTASRATLLLRHPAFGEMQLQARDASVGGFFAKKGVSALPPCGTIVQVIIKRYTGALNENAVPMRIVHEQDDGIGLEFVS